MSDKDLYLMKSVVLEARLWDKLGKAKVDTFFGVSELIALAVDSFDFSSIANRKVRTRAPTSETKTLPYQRFFGEQNQREIKRIEAERARKNSNHRGE